MMTLQAFNLLLQFFNSPAQNSACDNDILYTRPSDSASYALFAVLRNEGSIEHLKLCLSHLVQAAGKSSCASHLS